VHVYLRSGASEGFGADSKLGLLITVGAQDPRELDGWPHTCRHSTPTSLLVMTNVSSAVFLMSFQLHGRR